MGLKKYIESLKKAAEERLRDLTPEEKKQRAKEDSKRIADRTMKVLKAAKQGMDKYQELSKKGNAVLDKAAEKTIQIAGKAEDIAGKLDDTVGKKVKGAFDAAKGKVDEIKESAAKKPTTGSSILDAVIPVVPETDETKPKPAAPKKEEPPKA